MAPIETCGGSCHSRKPLQAVRKAYTFLLKKLYCEPGWSRRGREVGKLDNRIAVVTGGVQGIGRGIASLFAQEGAAVAILDLDTERSRSAADELGADGAKTLGVAADVGDERDVKRAFATIMEALGEVDILVNNAGIGAVVPFEEMTTESWDEVMRVNLRSMFLCTREVLPAMRRKGWGRVINVASQVGHRGAPGLTHYAASKAGVLGFTRSLAYEVAREGVTVNALAPASVDTPMNRALPRSWFDDYFEQQPIGRFARVDEIAPSALLLASDEGAYYVGASMNMNGGDVMF